jgi:hypothetical protein
VQRSVPIPDSDSCFYAIAGKLSGSDSRLQLATMPLRYRQPVSWDTKKRKTDLHRNFCAWKREGLGMARRRFFFWLGIFAFMIPHPCLDTLSSEDLRHSTAKVPLRHRWDGVLDRRYRAGDNAAALSPGLPRGRFFCFPYIYGPRINGPHRPRTRNAKPGGNRLVTHFAVCYYD